MFQNLLEGEAFIKALSLTESQDPVLSHFDVYEGVASFKLPKTAVIYGNSLRKT